MLRIHLIETANKPTLCFSLNVLLIDGHAFSGSACIQEWNKASANIQLPVSITLFSSGKKPRIIRQEEHDGKKRIY
jgi:hypothetical protein